MYFNMIIYPDRNTVCQERFYIPGERSRDIDESIKKGSKKNK